MAEVEDTLFNRVFRDTFRNRGKMGNRYPLDLVALRRDLANAQRYVLDDKFAEMLAHLACVPFRVPMERQPDVLDSLRHSAIPPHDIMWVEYNGHAFRKGLLEMDHGDAAISKNDVFGHELLPPSEAIIKETGWLIKRVDNVATLLYFVTDEHGEGMVLPFSYLWSLNDDQFEMEDDLKADTVAGMFAHGVSGLQDPRIAVVEHWPRTKTSHVIVEDANSGDKFPVSKLVIEFGGVVRYALAFLATLDSTPKIKTEVKPHRGFMGKGQVRQYLSHVALTLQLPAKQTMTRYAKKLIAMARRGWHKVRAHHRVMHKVLGGRYCARRDDHLWSAYDETKHAVCTQCDATRVWIELPNGRGDPTIAVQQRTVTHVTRGELH